MAINKDLIGQKFIRTGLEYLSINDAEFYKLIQSVETDFLKLINENAAYRKQWGIKIGNEEIDLGLLQRKKTDKKDLKYILHDKFFALEKHLKEKEVDIGRYSKFLDNLKKLQSICINKAYDFANILDTQLPGYSFARNVQAARALHTLRLNAYKFRPGEVIARPHTDRCTFTFHLHESEPGLTFVFPDGTEYAYESKQHTAAVFPGKKLQVITGGSFNETTDKETDEQIITSTPGLLNALPHYVRQHDSSQSMRVSIVFFVHTPHEVVNMK
jgi:hypothetical protein